MSCLDFARGSRVEVAKRQPLVCQLSTKESGSPAVHQLWSGVLTVVSRAFRQMNKTSLL